MPALTEQGTIERLEAVNALVREEVATDEQAAIERFVGAYYRQVDPDDLADLDTADKSFMHVEIDRIPDAATMAALADDLVRVPKDVRLAAADWRPMLARLEDIIADLERRPPPIEVEDVDEGKAFLPLACRRPLDPPRLSLQRSDALRVKHGSELGILRGRDDDRPSASSRRCPPRHAPAPASMTCCW